MKAEWFAFWVVAFLFALVCISVASATMWILAAFVEVLN